MRSLRTWLCIVSSILICALSSNAQQVVGDTLTIAAPKVAAAKDSIVTKSATPTQKSVVIPIEGKLPDPKSIKAQSLSSKPFLPNPKAAVLWSIIPGGGQIYNRKYWKVPIIVGAYVGCYYAITWNHRNLTEYANAYRDIKSDTPLENTSWQAFLPYNAKPDSYVNNSSFHDRLRRGRDFYRRNRDLSIIVSVGVYLLQMIDAYVDAELYAFDISPNVSLSYQPMVAPPSIGQPNTTYGVQLAMTF